AGPGAGRSESEAAARARQAHAAEVDLLAGMLHRAFADLVPLVEQLDLLELLEGFAEGGFGVVELVLELLRRAAEIVATGHRGLGIGRIGEVPGIVNSRALLLDLDLAVEIARHALELGDHALDLRHLPAPFLDLKFLQAEQRFTRLHRPTLPEVQAVRAPNSP